MDYNVKVLKTTLQLIVVDKITLNEGALIMVDKHCLSEGALSQLWRESSSSE